MGGLKDFPVNPYQRLEQKLGLIPPAPGLQPQGLFVRLFSLSHHFAGILVGWLHGRVT